VEYLRWTWGSTRKTTRNLKICCPMTPIFKRGPIDMWMRCERLGVGLWRRGGWRRRGDRKGGMKSVREGKR